MKVLKILIVGLLFLSPLTNNAQEGESIFDARGQHIMNEIIKKRGNNNNAVKTPADKYYDDKSFLLGSVFYEGKKMPDEYYLRYNAIKDIIETSQNGVSDFILPNEKISCTIWGEKYFYTKFYKGEDVKKGYLKLIFSGEDFKIYERETVVYKKGKKARTSLTLDIPAKYIKNNSFYLKENNGIAKKISSKKKKFIKSFKKENQKDIKTFIKRNKTDLSNKNDVVKFYKYYKTLK